MTASNTDTIERTLATLRADLAAKQGERDRLALALVDNPGAVATADNLQAIERAIEETDKRIVLYEAALRASESRDLATAAAGRIAQAAQARDRALQVAHARKQIGKQIDDCVAKLGDLVRRWSEASEQCGHEVVAVIDATAPTVEARLDAVLSVKQFASPAMIAQPLGQALLREGIGESGSSAYTLNIHFTVDPTNSCERTAAENADQLATRLDGLLQKVAA